MGFDLREILWRLAAILPALTIHEFAHAYSALRMGDPTAKMAGRVSLNPIDHLDPIGTLMIMFGPFGWAKPVPVDPHNFRDPAKGDMICSLFGPLANITLGVLAGLVFRIAVRMPGAPMLATYLFTLTIINFCLAMFNLVPLGVLDGHHILRYFLPYGAKVRYHSFNARYGMALLLALILLGRFLPVDPLGLLLEPALALTALVTGVPLHV